MLVGCPTHHDHDDRDTAHRDGHRATPLAVQPRARRVRRRRPAGCRRAVGTIVAYESNYAGKVAAGVIDRWRRRGGLEPGRGCRPSSKLPSPRSAAGRSV